MRVQLARVREGPFRFQLELDLASRDLAYEEFAEPPKVSAVGLVAVRGRGKYSLAGTVRADVAAICVRCLEVSPQQVERNFDLTFVPVSQVTDDASEDAPEEATYEGDEIDLTPVVEEQFNLSIPMRFLCSENCRGLCPHCGASRNLGDCGCGDKQQDPRFDVLKSLLR